MYGLIAHTAFVVLLVIGWTFGELGPRVIAILFGIWCAAFLAASSFPVLPFSTFVALLDVVLVLIIFKGDLRLR